MKIFGKTRKEIRASLDRMHKATLNQSARSFTPRQASDRDAKAH